MDDYDTYDKDGTRLFRVRGTCKEDVMTTQIQPEKVLNWIQILAHLNFRGTDKLTYNDQINTRSISILCIL